MHQSHGVLPDAIQSAIFDFIGDAADRPEDLESDTLNPPDEAAVPIAAISER